MKRLAVLLIAVFALVVPNAFAQCPTAPSGPHSVSAGFFFDYTPDASCVSASGGVSPITMSCGRQLLCGRR